MRLNFSNSSSLSTSTTPFELIHCDVWTPPIASISGYRYYLVLLEDFSHYCWTFRLTSKSEVHTIANFWILSRLNSVFPLRVFRPIMAPSLSIKLLPLYFPLTGFTYAYRAIIPLHKTARRTSSSHTEQHKSHHAHTHRCRPHTSRGPSYRYLSSQSAPVIHHSQWHSQRPTS